MTEQEKYKIRTCGECAFFCEWRGNMGCSAVPGHHIEVVAERPCCDKYREPSAGKPPRNDLDSVADRVLRLENSLSFVTRQLVKGVLEAQKSLGTGFSDRKDGE